MAIGTTTVWDPFHEVFQMVIALPNVDSHLSTNYWVTGSNSMKDACLSELELRHLWFPTGY
jgi:hypothetical protein